MHQQTQKFVNSNTFNLKFFSCFESKQQQQKLLKGYRSNGISLLGLKHPFDYEIVDSSGMAQLIIPLVCLFSNYFIMKRINLY